MGWLSIVIALFNAAPQVIAVISQIIDIINGHPQGAVAGAEAVSAHMAAFKADAPVTKK